MYVCVVVCHSGCMCVAVCDSGCMYVWLFVILDVCMCGCLS